MESRANPKHEEKIKNIIDMLQYARKINYKEANSLLQDLEQNNQVLNKKIESFKMFFSKSELI
jgi:polyhydroxyalkanoate synthesis regulator phasin